MHSHTISRLQEDHKRAKVTAAFVIVNNVSKLGKPKLNTIFVRLL